MDAVGTRGKKGGYVMIGTWMNVNINGYHRGDGAGAEGEIAKAVISEGRMRRMKVLSVT